MTNTKGTNTEVEERLQYAIELRSQDVPNSVVVEKLHEKYKKSYQTHRKDVKEANKVIVNRLRKDKMLLEKLMATNAYKDLESSVAAKKEQDLNEMEIIVKGLEN